MKAAKLDKINLHIHSLYSDGRNKIERIVETANRLHFRVIAITDHFSNSWKAGVIKTLDSPRKIQNYLEKITKLNKQLNAQGTDLKVLKGIEIDLGSSKKYIESMINPAQFDLILLEYLHSPESIGFIQTILQEWKRGFNHSEYKFPLLGLAHFDPSRFLFGNIDVVLTFLQKYTIYFEFNSAYSSYYSIKYKENFFDKFKAFEVMVGIGSDAHSVHELDYVHEPHHMIEYYDLEKNLKNLMQLLV
ncbi:MAG: hypothetical protein BAJALOKI1v1_270011 [Promethearchaeota archaeon]|nr:MAG: hypothetical protein BAJALOKI1v1_270011 [Candidatus Lokiarchaeota archaeon]